MNAYITDVQPNPISVQSGRMVLLTAKVTSLVEVPKARLEFENSKPAVAEMCDSDERGDRVHSNRKKLSPGGNNVPHEICFRLEELAEQIGAIIGISIYVQNAAGERVSPPYDLLAVIGA